MSYLFKCRCSAIGQIMTEPRSKADKEAGLLGETAKSYIELKFIEDTLGLDREVMTEQIRKGLLCEQDSIQLVQEVLGGTFRTKFRERLENDFLTGCPDILNDGIVEDVKTSFDVYSFFKSELTKDYFFQLQGYMALTGLSKARLIYCLVDTPENIVAELVKRQYFNFDCDEYNEDFARISANIEKTHQPSKMLSANRRIRVFEFDRDNDVISKIYSQVLKARNYYETLKFTEYEKSI